MKNFEKLLDLANENKKRRTHDHKGTTYCMLNSDEIYSALIMDAEYIKNDSAIVLCLAIIKASSCIERTFTFKVFNGSSARYEAICETLGTNGNPSDLIGKCVYMHIERNGDYQNLRVDAEMDKSEFEEMISDISKNTRGKKKADSKNIPYAKSFSKKNEITNEEDDFEEEFLEDEEEE